MTLQERYAQILNELRVTAARYDREDVTLLAVSKTFPVESIRALYDCGCRAFGENRVPELEAKAAALPADIQWHMIGQLQANKVRKVVRCAAWIHSVDSEALLRRLDRIAGEEGRTPKILLEVNVSGEESKSGCTPQEALHLGLIAASMEHLDWQGLMTMAPADANEEELRRVFGGLRQLRDDLSRQTGRPLPVLSMGMSGDFPAAIREGATIVRIGSAIFGNR